MGLAGAAASGNPSSRWHTHSFAALMERNLTLPDTPLELPGAEQGTRKYKLCSPCDFRRTFSASWRQERHGQLLQLCGTRVSPGFVGGGGITQGERGEAGAAEG